MEEAKKHTTARQFRRWRAFFDARPSREPGLVGLAVVGWEVFLLRLVLRSLFETVDIDREFRDYIMGEAPEVEEEDPLEGADTGTILEAKLEQIAQRKAVWFAALGVDKDGKPITRGNPAAFKNAMR